MQCNHNIGKRKCKAHALKGKRKCMFHAKPGQKKTYRKKK